MFRPCDESRTECARLSLLAHVDRASGAAKETGYAYRRLAIDGRSRLASSELLTAENQETAAGIGGQRSSSRIHTLTGNRG